MVGRIFRIAGAWAIVSGIASQAERSCATECAYDDIFGVEAESAAQASDAAADA